MRKNILFIISAILLGYSNTLAYDFSAVCSTGQTLYYNIVDAENHEVELTYQGTLNEPWNLYDSPTGSVILPSIVENDDETFIVISIGNGAFYGCFNITSINIPNTVISIGENVFVGCSGLKSITIPESVTSIGMGAFSACGLESITIPNSITSIGINVFRGCRNLTSVHIPNTVTSICDYAFYGCGLRVVTIPEHVNSIGRGAFEICKDLNSVLIPNSVISIGEWCFRGCTALTSITIPNSIDSIAEHVFGDCYNLETIVLPSSLIYIGNTAFYGCTGLTSIAIPDFVTYIGNLAFYGCSGLKSVTLGNSLITIGLEAFYDCKNIETITSRSYFPPNVGYNAFLGVPKSIPVYVSPCTISEYQTTTEWKNFSNFQQSSLYLLSVLSDCLEMGDVNVSQQPDCEHDAIVLATPNEGVVFIGWMEDGALVSTENPYQFTLTCDRNLVACFGYYGLDDNELPEVYVYPNPFKDVITIKGLNLKEVEINNIMGQYVSMHQLESTATRIDISALLAGVYFICITDENGRHCVKKIVKE